MGEREEILRRAPPALLLLATLAGPAAAQTVAWPELEGLVVQAEITRQQVAQRQKTFEQRVHDVIKISIEPGDFIDYSITTTVHGPGGTTKLDPAGALYRLNVVRHIAGGGRGAGAGDALWTFADGTLSFLRTYPAGARRHTIAFARDSTGLKCTASTAFAREDGSGPVRIQAPDGQFTTILRFTPLSSQCKVFERKN